MQIWDGFGADAERALVDAASLLRAGECVAFPTETVYGLGADATNSAAVRKIFEAKGRPSDNPLIVHLHEPQAVHRWIRATSELEQQLMERFWPGPLTIVFSVEKGIFSELVTAGLDTVGIRVPAHELARRLIACADRPIAAPSANRSGRPSPTSAEHVQEDLGERIAGIFDAGFCEVGLESTVVRCVGSQVIVLRPGGVTIDELKQVADSVVLSEELQVLEAPRSPGMKYTHYAPRGIARVFQIAANGETQEDLQALNQKDINHLRVKLSDFIMQELLVQSEQKRVAIIAFKEVLEELKTQFFEQEASQRVVLWYDLDSPNDSQGEKQHEATSEEDLGTKSATLRYELASKQIYRALRACDEHQADLIWIQGCKSVGLGLAYMNRIRKAADGDVFHIS